MRPAVSVIIPTFNRADVLQRAVTSVLAQTYQNFEIIIVDDCSNDSTLDVVQAMTDSRIQLVRHETNKGGSAARNTGIARASGEFIAFLDSDDEWLPGKLEKQLALFDRPEVGLVYCGFIHRGGIGFPEIMQLIPVEADWREQLTVRNSIGTTSVSLFKKEILEKISGFDESMKGCQDWDTYLRASDICEVRMVPEYLAIYYIDRSARKQISTNRRAVIDAHKRVTQKYRQKIEALPRDKALAHIDHMLIVYRSTRYLPGTLLALKAFMMTGNLRYVDIFLRIVVKAFALPVLGVVSSVPTLMLGTRRYNSE